jgi:dihydroorotase
VGLETALPLVLELVEEGVLTLGEAVRAMTVNPALAFGLDKGILKVGGPADITLVDLEKKWTVDPKSFKSKGRNTPFGGREVKGAVVKTIVDGEVVFNK